MRNNQGRTKRIAKNTIYMFMRMMLVMCVSFYTSRVVLNTLGVEDYGIYNIVGSIVVFLTFLKSALNNATYRYLTYELGNENKNTLKQTFIMAVNVHVILAFIIFLIMEIIGVWFLNNRLNIPLERMFAANCIFQLSLLIFLLEIIKTPFNSSIISHEQMKFYAYTSIVEAILKLSIIYLLLLVDWDKLILYGFLLLIVSLIMFVWYICYCYCHFPETHYKFYWDSGMMYKFTSYSGWSVLVNVSDVSVQQCINIFLNLFGGVTVNAAMGVANQVNGFCRAFLESFSTSFKPQIIKSYAQNEFTYFIQLILSTSKFSYFLLFSIAFPVLLNIDFLLEIWLISPPVLTSKFLVFIIIYSLIDAISSPLWTAVHATGILRTHQILMSSIKLLNIPIGYLLLKYGFALYTIVAIYAILNGVCCVVRGIYMKTLINLPLYEYFFNVIFRCTVCSFISSVLPFLYKAHQTNEDWFDVLTSCVIFYIPYFILIYYLGLTKKEQIFFISILKKKLHIKKSSCLNCI